MADLLLGIDGGGSKTRAILASRSGSVLGLGAAGSSNYQSVGFAQATTSLSIAIQGAFDAAGLAIETPIAAACFGLAGVDRPADTALFSEWIKTQGIASRVAVVNDAELVLAAGTPNGWGIALICGTGSICYGRAPDGRTARTGGWGYLLGDEGSGYDIGLHALRLATQTADDRADAHVLLRTILSHWNLAEPHDLIGYVYRPEMTRAEIAGIARLVAELAGDDPHTRAILEGAARELGRLIAAVVRQLDLQTPHVAIGGGLIGSSLLMQHLVRQAADATLGPLRHVDDPAHGALIIAQRLIA